VGQCEIVVIKMIFRKGDKAGAEKLTPEQRKEIAQKAAQIRWSR